MKKLIAFLALPLFISGLAIAASITVTKPAANDTWLKGQSYTITWTKTGQMPANVRIVLRNKASTDVIQEIVDPAPNTGAYLWPVPATIPNGEYRIRVKVKNVDIFDDSEIFTIGSGQPGPGPGQKATAKAATQLQNTPALIQPFIKVVIPAENSTVNNGAHVFVTFDASTMPGDALEIDLHRESGQKVVPIYYGAYGEGTSAPPAGAAHPRRYIYDWQVPYGDIMAPGNYKIRIHSLGKDIIAWSGKFFITWPMKEKEYIFDAAITNAACITSASGLTPPPVRPQCEQPENQNHAYVGYDVFDYPGNLTANGHPLDHYWRCRVRHPRLMFPIEQFQGKKVNVKQAKMVLKKECTVAINSSLPSCYQVVYRLDAALPQATIGDQCLNMARTALVTLSNTMTEQDVYVTDTVEHWIDGKYPNFGFLVTVFDETPPLYTPATCISGYTVKLHLKIEEEFKGYD